MRDFHHNGARIELSPVPGVVLAADRSSTTEYQLSGGGGFVQANGGYVPPARLDSATTETQELWLKQADGVHRVFHLKGTTVPVLPGQKVVMVLGTTDGAVRVPVGLLNASSKTWHPLGQTGIQLIWLVDMPATTPSVWLMWAAIVVAFIMGALMWGFGERGSDWQATGMLATLGAPCFGFCYFVYNRFVFAARVQTAHEKMQTQAAADSWQFLATSNP